MGTDDMVNIQSTLMRAGTALNNSLYRASGGRVMRKIRGLPMLLITLAGRKTAPVVPKTLPPAGSIRA